MFRYKLNLEFMTRRVLSFEIEECKLLDESSNCYNIERNGRFCRILKTRIGKVSFDSGHKKYNKNQFYFMYDLDSDKKEQFFEGVLAYLKREEESLVNKLKAKCLEIENFKKDYLKEGKNEQ